MKRELSAILPYWGSSSWKLVNTLPTLALFLSFEVLPELLRRYICPSTFNFNVLLIPSKYHTYLSLFVFLYLQRKTVSSIALSTVGGKIRFRCMRINISLREVIVVKKRCILQAMYDSDYIAPKRKILCFLTPTL